MARSLTRSFIRHVWANGLDPSITSLWRFFMKHSGNCHSTISPSSSSQNKSSWSKSSVDILEAFIQSIIEFEAPKVEQHPSWTASVLAKFKGTGKRKPTCSAAGQKWHNCACLCLCLHPNQNTAGPVCRCRFSYFITRISFRHHSLCGVVCITLMLSQMPLKWKERIWRSQDYL